ncbi:helix-turn-helix domain-containing protein [Halovivax limisalsi]|uniref:helix-turn-helix domain-containing protein n=1 Tax=Halovivax limisalsi TaxID=1453760 RepID=UPI001FFD4B12|nr:helix-turn-helix domain-containing protein [Halovivax limisalsi]
MKRVRLTLHPTDSYAPALYERLAGGAAFLDRVRIENWNVAKPPTAFLLRLTGDYRRFEAELAAAEMVDAYELLPIAERECHCFLEGRVDPAARSLFETFTRGSLLTIPPVVCHDDGSNSFTIVGTDADIQRAVEAVPDDVGLVIDAVGGETVAPADARAALSPRQRTAVETALELGYYEVPRTATTADVAAELDCATATAAEHLQRAEARVLETLFRR